ncbi:MAG TPA: cytochrome c [Rhodothermales bacterium]|nr:cytochrome c [Rhodothermales bacterium]
MDRPDRMPKLSEPGRTSHVNMLRFSTLVALAMLALAGCRGMESEKPPIHPVLNMDFMEKFDPQEANVFFADSMSMRHPVPGTIARGMLKADTRLYQGRTESGDLVQTIPIPVTEALMKRGQERFDIYCSVCHGYAGDGLGIIMTGQYGFTPAPSYHQDRLREVPDGYIYDVILNGVRTMPSYATQVAVKDRWAIVAYIRALQRSQNASRADVPAQVLPTLNPVGPPDSTAAGPPANETGSEADTTNTDTTGATQTPG